MDKKDIEKLRESIVERLREYRESGAKDYIKLDIEKEILQQILFEDNKFAIPDNLWKLLDLSDVSFKGINVTYVDFTESKGVVLDPQIIADKNLLGTKLADVIINGSLDGVYIRETDFTRSKGAVLNPQTILFASFRGLYKTKLADVIINGSFDGVDVTCTDFTECKGAIPDTKTEWHRILYYTKLSDGDLSHLDLDGDQEIEEKIFKRIK